MEWQTSGITRLRADAPQLAAGRKREVTAPKPWRRRVSRSGGVPLDFVTDAPQLAAGSFTEAWERLLLEAGDPTGMFPKRYQAGRSDFRGNHRHPEKKRRWRGY